MYLVFAGDFYYPEGGAKDLVGIKYSLEDALELVDEVKVVYNWWHIFNAEAQEITRESQNR